MKGKRKLGLLKKSFSSYKQANLVPRIPSFFSPWIILVLLLLRLSPPSSKSFILSCSFSLVLSLRKKKKKKKRVKKCFPEFLPFFLGRFLQLFKRPTVLISCRMAELSRVSPNPAFFGYDRE